jgi:hypothetical protein
MKALTFTARRLSTALGALIALSGLTACGNSSYEPVSSESQTEAPGDYAIPAKMDILLAVDDTGSSLNDDVMAPLQSFISKLDSQNWDFRVATTPLTHAGNISQVAVSKFDIKSGSRYKAPYPGAIASGSSLAVFPNQLVLPSATVTGGAEPGINSIAQTLENEALYLSGNGAGTRFLRSDAMTIVIVVSTSDDTSEGTPSYSSGLAATEVSATLTNRILTSKDYSSSNGTKVYSFVNAGTSPTGPYTASTSCLGPGNSFSGNRYMQLAMKTGGKYFDICSTPVTQIFDQLNKELDVQRQSFISEYVFIEQEPELSTVKIEKIRADGSTQIIPNASSSSNGGWTYIEGFQNNLPSISYPIKMNYRSGYAFKLSGNFVLKGAEKAKVTFKTRGLQNSQ